MQLRVYRAPCISVPEVEIACSPAVYRAAMEELLQSFPGQSWPQWLAHDMTVETLTKRFKAVGEIWRAPMSCDELTDWIRKIPFTVI